MSNKMSIQLNGKEVISESDKTVLSILGEKEINVPSLCYHPSLGPIETCDSCIVKNEFTSSIIEASYHHSKNNA